MKCHSGELGFMITSVRNSIWNEIGRELEPLNITTAQYVVLNTIHRGRGKTISEFSRILDYDSGAMTRLLDRIEQKGLIRRVANPEDRRSYIIELTAESTVVFPVSKAVS